MTLKGVDEGFQAIVDRAALRPVPLDRRDPLRRRAGVGGPVAGERPRRLHDRAAKPPKPGWYVFRQSVPGTAGAKGTESNCTDPLERVKVIAQPLVHTQVSDQQVTPGASITDLVVVEGLGGEKATIQAALYGPFASRDAINCDGKPVWTGTVEANGDGEYRTEPFKVQTPGYYTYRESLAESEFVRPTETPCLDAAETTVVSAAPQVVTQVSDTKVRPGAQLTDKLTVTGAGPLTLIVNVELFGPFATKGGISCSGAPFWKGTVPATGDGTYTTAPATVDKVGYYTYRESIAAAPQTAAFTGKCGVTAETSLVTAAPRVDVGRLRRRRSIRAARSPTRSRVTRARRLRGEDRRAALRPFATQAAIKCTGTPYAARRSIAQGRRHDPHAGGARAGRGLLHLPRAPRRHRPDRRHDDRVPDRARDGARAAADHHRPQRRDRLQPLGRGRSAPADARARREPRHRRAGLAGRDRREERRPRRARARSRSSAGGSTAQMPGAKSGAVLIAGHVDSATPGAGAFFRLKDAGPATVIQVTTQNGRTFSYRVTAVQTMPKSDLPTDIYSRSGAPRLVLVTCGGPFDAAAGHYRDNVVVTAVPV